MKKSEAKKIAYDDHNITYEQLKNLITNSNLEGFSKVNPIFTKKAISEMLLGWISHVEKTKKITDVVVSTRLKHTSSESYTLTVDGLAMVNVLTDFS